MKKIIKKFYAYYLGKDVGVVESWQDCQKIVSGKEGARYKSFLSKEDAILWLKSGADYKVKNLSAKEGIYFDAGTGSGNGVEVSVTDKNGKSLLNNVLSFGKINQRGFYLLPKNFTNNYGELLACKFALEIALKQNIKNIFGDSKLVIDFWSKGYIKKDKLPKETINLSDEVKKLRKDFELSGGTIVLISGSNNPADLGFHKQK